MNAPGIAAFVVALATLASFLYLGFHQLYLAKHVDRLEREGKITADSAARVRKKPMKLIGCVLIGSGVAAFCMYCSSIWHR